MARPNTGTEAKFGKQKNLLLQGELDTTFRQNETGAITKPVKYTSAEQGEIDVKFGVRTGENAAVFLVTPFFTRSV